MITFEVQADFDFDAMAQDMGSPGMFAGRDVVGLAVMQDGEQIARLVLAMVDDRHGNDLVVFALQGAGYALIKAVDDFATWAVRMGGLDGVRVFTSRRGFARHAKTLGWQEVQRVYRKEVGHG